MKLKLEYCKQVKVEIQCNCIVNSLYGKLICLQVATCENNC
jgi:hypothetical protein